MEKQIRKIIKLVRDFDQVSTTGNENGLYLDIAKEINSVFSEAHE